MKRFSIASVVILCVIVSSCNFMRKEVTPEGKRNVTIHNKTYAIDYWLGSIPENNDKDSYHQYIKQETFSNLKQLLNGFFGDIHDEKNIQEVTLYIDTVFNQPDVTVKPENIKGIQIHYVEDSYLKTNFYTYANNTVKKIDALDSFVEYYTQQAVYETSKIFNAAKNSVFIFVVDNPAPKYLTDKSNYDKNLADYILSKK